MANTLQSILLLIPAAASLAACSDLPGLYDISDEEATPAQEGEPTPEVGPDCTDLSNFLDCVEDPVVVVSTDDWEDAQYNGNTSAEYGAGVLLAGVLGGQLDPANMHEFDARLYDGVGVNGPLENKYSHNNYLSGQGPAQPPEFDWLEEGQAGIAVLHHDANDATVVVLDAHRDPFSGEVSEVALIRAAEALATRQDELYGPAMRIDEDGNLSPF